MTRRLGTFICLLALLCPIVPGQSSGQSSAPSQASSDPAKLIIPEGTEIHLSLRDPLSSKLNEPGDEVYAIIRRDVIIEGRTLLKQGTEVIGKVTVVQGARRMLRGGMLHITFDRIRLDGGEQRLSAIVKSASDFTRDEKVKSDGEGSLKGGKSGGDVMKNIGTAASIGGVGATIIILSSADRNVLGGTGRGIGISRGGAVAGASILGASVIAGILLTKGKEVRLDQGTIVRLKLERSLAIS